MSSRVYFNYTICLASNKRRYQSAKGIESLSHCFLESLLHSLIARVGLVGLVVRGESPGCRLISTASMWEWLRNLLPHHSQESSTERWSRNTLRVVTASVLRPQGIFNIFQWRRQRHLTWSATHDVVSREINPWKGFDLLRGSNHCTSPSLLAYIAIPGPETQRDTCGQASVI